MPELKTRIQLKYDTLANWNASTFILKKGEVAIATMEIEDPAQAHLQPVMFKVGDGTKTFSQLGWTSAKAADVYSWAKKSEAQFTKWVKGLITVDDISLADYFKKTEVNGLLKTNSEADQKYTDDAIKAAVEALDVADTAVTGKYVSAVSEVDGKIEVSREDLPVYTLASGTANGTVAFNGADVAVTGLGSAAYTKTDAYATSAQGAKADSAVQKVAVLGKELSNEGSVSVDEAKTALGLKSAAYAETTAFDAAGSAAAVLGTAADEATANTVYGAKAAAAKAQSDIDAFLAAAEKGDAALDTLKEIQDFLKSDDGAVAGIVGNVAANAAAIEDIIDGTTTIAKAANADTAAQASGLNATGEAAVKAVKVDNATNADKAADADKLGGSAAADYLKKAEAPGYNDILTKTAAEAGYQPKGEYATKAQGELAATAVQPAALNSYYTKTEADTAFMTSDEVDAKITALNLDANYEPIGAEDRAKTYADGLAGNYATAAQGALAASALQEITTTANGGLKVTNKNQIDIDNSVVFVFDCGNATDKIYD